MPNAPFERLSCLLRITGDPLINNNLPLHSDRLGLGFTCFLSRFDLPGRQLDCQFARNLSHFVVAPVSMPPALSRLETMNRRSPFRFTRSLFALAICLLFVGCGPDRMPRQEELAQSKEQASPRETTRPDQQMHEKAVSAVSKPAPPKAYADDPAAVAALQQAGYLIETNSDGIVTSVSVTSNSDVSDTYQHFGGVAKVTQARFSGPGIADLGLEVLANWKGLERLDLTDSAITDKTLDVIAQLPGLQVLSLRRVGVTDQGLMKLATLQKLRAIDLRNTNIGDEGMKALAKLSSLQDAQLEKSEVTDSGVKELVGLPLKSFNANYCTSLTNETLAVFANIPTLEQIQLDYTKINDEGMKSLQGLKKLKRLRIRGCDVTGEGIKAIAGATEMARMELRDTSIDDDALAVIAKYPKLTYLDLGECRLISPEGIKQLGVATGLTYLGFWETKLNDDAFNALGGLVNLTELDLKSTNLSDESLDTLLKFQKLEKLNVAGVRQLTDEGFARIGSLPNLKWINVAVTNIGSEGFDGLEENNKDLKIIEYEN